MTDNIYSFSDDEFTPLNRAEFCASLSAFRRRGLSVGVVLVLVFFLMLWAFGAIAGAMNDAGVPLESPWRYLLIVGLLPAGFMMIWIANLCLQHPLLKCPHCSHSFAGGMDPYYAIVTERCSNCAKPLFESAQPASEETPRLPDDLLLSREKLLADLANSRRAALRLTLIWGISGIILVVLGSVSGRWLSYELASQLGDVWTPFVAPALLAPGIFVAAWSLAVWSRHFRTSRPCPHCGAPILASDFASITGNCSTCGHKAVSDPWPGIEPSDDRAAVSKWSAIEFQRVAKPLHDRLWIGCLVGGGFAALWLSLLYSMSPSGGNTQISLNSLWGATVFVFGFGGMLLFQCTGVLLWHWYSARQLRCPKCHSELVHVYRLVVSSKRCYHCGATVIHDRGADTP